MGVAHAYRGTTQARALHKRKYRIQLDSGVIASVLSIDKSKLWQSDRRTVRTWSRWMSNASDTFGGSITHRTQSCLWGICRLISGLLG